MICATVVWAAPHALPREIAVELPTGSTLLDAVRAAGFAVAEEDLLDLGVFNRPQVPETVLCQGDRVEIYRPLQVDPKEARRIRAEVRRRRQKKSG